MIHGMRKSLALIASVIAISAASVFSADVNQTLTIHLYSPWKDDATRNAPPAYIEVSGSGGPLPFRGMKMTPEGGDWFVASTPVQAKNPTDGYMTFLFANYIPNASDVYGGRDIYQNGGTQFRLDSLFFAHNRTEVWIFPQGAGVPPIVKDYAPPKKVLAFYNPWALGAPAVKVGAAAAYKKMRLPPEGDARCGWYLYYFSDDYSAAAASLQVSFNNIIGGETYGAGGLKDTKGIELQTLFATHDTVFVVPDPIPGGPAKLLTNFPEGVVGTCHFPLAVTIRDFSYKNPDFNHAGSFPDKVTKGMVLPDLDAQNKPVKSATPYLQSDFSNWFRDDSTNADPNLRNYTTCSDLPMSKKDDGYWGYSSYTDDTTKGYFPIQKFNRFNETSPIYYNVNYDKNQLVATTTPGNFSFCMEMDAEFTYQKGQKFSFVGDDDVWVFINKKLVIDIGGTHSPAKDSVDLDKLGMTEGSKNDFRLFYCERQISGSNLYIQTSIYFEQQQSVYSELLPGKTNEWNIWERISGDRSCTSSSTDKVQLAVSDFKLSGPSVTPAVALPVGTSYGGITIDPSKNKIIADTSKMTGLAPGVYTVTFVSQATKKGGFIQFTIVNYQVVDFAGKPAVSVVKGTAVPVTIEAILKGVADKRAEAFQLAPQAGLQVFEDSAMTKPVAGNLTTDAATGTKKVWVTSQTAGTYKVDLKDGTRASLQDTYNNIVILDRPKAAKPASTPAGGDFSSLLPKFEVSLATATAGASILYTLDGTAPGLMAGGSTLTYVAGTAIPLTATTTIMAIAVKPGWDPSDVMTEKFTKVIPPKTAAPVATPPSRNFTVPLPVNLISATTGAAIFYTTDGTDPATAVGGSTKAWTAAVTFTATTTLKAIAVGAGLLPSDIMTEKYAFLPPVGVAKARYLDKDGDGRIETVLIDYDKDLQDLPAKLAFKINGDGMPDETRTALKAEMAFTGAGHSQVTVTLASPFPFGMTSVPNAAASGQQFLEESIPLLDASFAVADSVPPVVFSATVNPPDSANPLVRVVVTFSEVVDFPAAGKTALIFKRGDNEMPATRLIVNGVTTMGSRQYEIRIDSTSTLFPIVGDSVAANNDGQVKDAAGNIPVRKLFHVLGGTVPKAKPTKVYVAFANGAMQPGAGSRGADEASVPADVLFIPFDKNNQALQGAGEDGKCGGCYVGTDGKFIGPIIYMEIPGPVEYDFKIFSTLGEFVASGKGKLSQQDIDALTPIQGGTRYLARIAWTGRASQGEKVGTGAYILNTVLKTEKDLKTGAPPGTDIHRLVFGILRNFRGN